MYAKAFGAARQRILHREGVAVYGVDPAHLEAAGVCDAEVLPRGE